jgi:hypothetical protein
MDEIQPIDPVARRNALIVFIVVAILGGVVASRMESWKKTLEQRLRGQGPAEAVETQRYLALGTVTVVTAPMALAGGYFCWLGRRTLRGKRFPPPGMRVIKPTRVLREEAAIRLGRWLVTIGILIVVLSLGAYGWIASKIW